MLLVLFLPVAIALAATLLRFWSSWQILRDLLTTLNSLEIGRFFEQFPDFEGSGPVWIRDLNRMSLAVSVNSAIALHNLAQKQKGMESIPNTYWDAVRAFRSPPPDQSPWQVLQAHRQFLVKSAEISKDLAAQILQEWWKKNEIPFVQSPQKKAASEASSPLVQVNFAQGALQAAAPLHFVATVGGSSQPAPAADRASADSDKEYETAFKYVALQYAIFIGYALRHIQNLLLCAVLSFVLLVLALNSFSFDGPQAISRLLMASLVAGGVVVIWVLAQIERNPIISRLSGSEAGVLGKDFYQSVIVYGALPVLTVLGTQFPLIARFLTSWAEPTLGALK
jgi:hypothetical protein